MFCMQCGTQLPDTAQFCYACGKEIAIPQQTSTNKPQEPVIPDAVMDDIARKAAAEIGKNPVLRFRFLLENLEETATKGDFTASTLKQTFDLTDELNEITDTRILHDPEIKRL